MAATENVGFNAKVQRNLDSVTKQHKSATTDPRFGSPISADSDVIRYVIIITGLCISYWYQFRSDVSKIQADSRYHTYQHHSTHPFVF